LLGALLRSGDRVCLEGDNQKHAEVLTRALLELDTARVRDLHLLISTVGLPEHLELFRRGIASRLDFAFSGPCAAELATMVREGKIRIGAIHTYLELYARYLTDLTPQVSLIAAELADGRGNLYTGPHTEDTPIIAEATAFRRGIVVAQAARVVPRLPRVDIPGDWVDFVVETGSPPLSVPLFTRDPARLSQRRILMAMMVIKGIYARYGVLSLNHGIGTATAAIELILPTFGERIGQKGKICRHWVSNPNPTLIPAIENGWVKSICSFGSEPGMEEYVRSRPDIFFTGRDGSLRSNRLLAQVAGLYSVDAFTGATLQIDEFGNSSTVTRKRISGFGGGPNLGSSPPGRRHGSPSGRLAGEQDAAGRAQCGGIPRERKLVIQVTPTTIGRTNTPVFRKRLEALDLWQEGLFPAPPVMIYGDQITHIVTERGLAHLILCESLAERQAAIRAIAGKSDLSTPEQPSETRALRERGVIQFPADLEIREEDAQAGLLAAGSFADLVRWSGGLYHPPPEAAPSR
jgi:malonate decarboxylase alpha subunit